MQPRMLLVLLATRVHRGLEVGVRGLTLPGCFPAGWPQCILVHGVVPSHMQDFSFPFVDVREVSASPLSQPVQVPLNGNATSGASATPPSFVLAANLLRVPFAPLSMSLMKMISGADPWGIPLGSGFQQDVVLLSTTL